MAAQYLGAKGSATTSFTHQQIRLPEDQSSAPDYFGVGKRSEIWNRHAEKPAKSPIVNNAHNNVQQHRLNAQQEQQIFADKSTRLLDLLSRTSSVINDLRDFNGRHMVYYPKVASTQQQGNDHASLQRQALERSQTLISLPVDSDFQRQVPKRSNSLNGLSEDQADSKAAADNHRILTSEIANAFRSKLNVLNLDVKVGHHIADVNNLAQESITALLDDRLAQSIAHIEKIHKRVADTSSKVLVTGDLNAGKSTFVNALLKREILPSDQQPCTSTFCEVLDATLNDGVEQAHGVRDVAAYNRADPSTYEVIELRHLYKTVIEEDSPYTMLKIYTTDRRQTEESLLHNGVVDIALIDSPGLNTDSLKTTAVFARQEEIDVVVFVVSAENHFTLSGKEFLWNAANEKAHIFIVVNRFDSIRDKERCKRLILEQIRQLSPATYADAEDLVHFVSAGSVDLEEGSHKLDPEEFARLEEHLRAFVLENRVKSKLSPAKNYLLNILSDLHVISESNHEEASKDLEHASSELKADQPAYERLLSARDRIFDQIEKLAEDSVRSLQTLACSRLDATVDQIEGAIANLEYPGLLLIWQYAQDVVDSMAHTLQKEVKALEAYAKDKTSNTVDQIHELGSTEIGEYPRTVDVDSMFLKSRDRRIFVEIEATDFFDIDFNDKFSVLSVSLGAVTMVGGRVMGVKNVVSSIWNVSNVVGVNNVRRWMVPVMGIASVGLVVYVVSDMRYAVERKLSRKFKAAVKESNHNEGQSYRIARASRKTLRTEGWELQNRFQKAVDDKEKMRNEMVQKAQMSEEAMKYFSGVLSKTTEMRSKVESVNTQEVSKL
ncbi:mitofusin [Umbelopsis nana]